MLSAFRYGEKTFPFGRSVSVTEQKWSKCCLYNDKYSEMVHIDLLNVGVLKNVNAYVFTHSQATDFKCFYFCVLTQKFHQSHTVNRILHRWVAVLIKPLQSSSQAGRLSSR